jgi:hypothetical protein
MTVDPVPPKFLSLDFHSRFFPRLLLDRYLRRKKNELQGTTFTSTTEMFVTLAVCLILAIIGIPTALTRGSITGWILSILGVGGTILLLIMSVGAHWGNRPSYDDFLGGIFFFLVSLGVFIGIPVGMDAHSPWLGIFASLAGLFAGYALGIFAGLQLQRLGWFATIISMVAGLAAIVMTGGALFMLLGFLA